MSHLILGQCVCTICFVSAGSWRSGLGFNALIHAHRPDLINFSALQPSRHIENLNNAFDIANNELGIPRLLDAEGLATLLR
jgi:spectrin beta